ncbi:hypothetical protein [Pilimelia columellifera]|uniref:Uncharacterized protein n=1 Tax=Pilimelia columellifera subsp. columellifera TaxID=706583 RepID=A0ABN3NRC7_9ACTN
MPKTELTQHVKDILDRFKAALAAGDEGGVKAALGDLAVIDVSAAASLAFYAASKS